MREQGFLHYPDNSSIPPAPESKQAPERFRSAVIRGLIKFGAISEEYGHLVVDVEALKNWSSRNEINVMGGKANQIDVARTFSTMSGIRKSDAQIPGDGAPQEAPIMILPKSLADMEALDEGGYVSRSRGALLQPWEFGQRNKNWAGPIVLESGERTNMAEMAIISTLRKWEMKRSENNKLTVLHPFTGERVLFSASMIKDLAGINPQAAENKIHLTFDGRPLEFARKYAPNLLKAGILQEQDLRRQGNSAVVETSNAHTRSFSIGRKDGSKYAQLSYGGYSFKYYLGKKTLLGTDIPIDPKNIGVRVLGPGLAGVIERAKNGERIKLLAVFDLLNSEEAKVCLNEYSKSLGARARNLTPSQISARVVVKADQMKSRLRLYSASDYVPPRPGDSHKDYYKRLSLLDNPQLIFEKVQEFFSQAGVGVHNLRWDEQVVLANIILEKIDEQKLSEFAKKYGLSGVRTFLSLDYDKNIGSKILDLGENLDSVSAKQVFEKYGEIVDAANEAEGFVLSHLPIQKKEAHESAIRIREQLLRRAKDMLSGLADVSIVNKGQGKNSQILQELERVKANVLLFAATCKNLPEGVSLDFGEFAGAAIENKDSSELSNEEREEMRLIFQGNRSADYPPRLYTKTTEDFEAVVAEAGHTFRILKHEGKIVAFVHYDQISKDSVYVGSLNLHPSAKDSPVAVAMIRSALEEMNDKTIEAVVWEQNSARIFYTRMLGFKKMGEIKNYHNTGETYWKLERPKREGQNMELAKAA